MRHKHSLTATDRIFDPPRRNFTVQDANKSLVLVRRIVQDVVTHYAELRELRTRREELATAPGAADQVEKLRETIEQRIEEVNRLQEELNEVGCELKDFETGLIDFPCQHEGRTILLCWRLGEESVTNWHEVDAGFSGRRPIGPEFKG